jgi:hypothetical protein
MRVGWAGWSVEIGDEWSATDHPECLTLELSREGALQLSSVRKGSGDVTEDDLLSFLEGHEKEWGSATPTRCGEFVGLLVRYTKDDSEWVRWFVRNRELVLLATYNGSSNAAYCEYDKELYVLSSARKEPADETKR